MFNFLKNISGAIIIGISIIIGLNFQEFKDLSSSIIDEIIYVVSGQKAKVEENKKIYHDTLIKDIINKKKYLLTSKEINALVDIIIPKQCSIYDKRHLSNATIRNKSQEVIRSIKYKTYVKDKISKDIYDSRTKTKYFESGLHYNEAITYACYEATDTQLLSKSDELLIKRGFELITDIIKVNKYFNADVKSNKSKIRSFLRCNDYYSGVRNYKFKKNLDVEDLCKWD